MEFWKKELEEEVENKFLKIFIRLQLEKLIAWSSKYLQHLSFKYFIISHEHLALEINLTIIVKVEAMRKEIELLTEARRNMDHAAGTYWINCRLQCSTLDVEIISEELLRQLTLL